MVYCGVIPEVLIGNMFFRQSAGDTISPIEELGDDGKERNAAR
jgi:hypothetical protein